MGEGASVAFVTLGCKVNQAESEAIAEALGVSPARVAEDADVIVINTCTVTGEADHKARKAVRHAHGLPKAPVVVVTGCLAALEPAALAALGPRVVVEPDKALVAERVRSALGTRALEPSANASPSRRTRVQLKIEDGCDAFCAYCIVPHARGVPRSVPLAEIGREAGRLAAAGVAEVVLTGINIGRYRDGDARLADVLRTLDAAGIPRVRLSSIEPGDATGALLEVAAALPSFCRHLHVPLQAGADATLARMGRPYTTTDYAATLARAREMLPGVAITTDVIVGFPGESDEAFGQTCAFVASQRIAKLHVFRYSARPGTPAAEMPDQVPPAVKATRSETLRALGERLAADDLVARTGEVAELLVERIRTDAGVRFAEGTTREYVRARTQLAERDARAGDLMAVRIEGAGPDGVAVGSAL